MSIPIECPACEHMFSVPMRYGGKKGKCPECGTVFEAPKAAAVDDSLPRLSSQPPSPPVNGESNGDGLRIPLPNKVTQRVPTRIPESPPVNSFASVGAVEPEPPASPFSAFAKPSEPSPSVPTKPGDKDSPPPRHLARRSNAPLFAATGVLVILVVAGIVGIVLLNPFEKNPQASHGGTVAQDSPSGTDNNLPTKKPSPKKPTDDELKTLWQAALPVICQVIVETPIGTTNDAGFVVDARGWIATNYYAIKDASHVRVRFGAADETTEPVEAKGTGIVAFSLEHDLAIIEIQSEDADRFRQLKLNTEYEPVEDDYMVAVGWAADGVGLYAPSQIKRLVATALLPSNNVAYLRERHLDDLDDLVLIEHSRQVIAGVGGGPLLNLKGEAIGVNVQLSPTSRSGYAIPIKHLVELKESASGNVTPFVNAAVAKIPDPMPTPAVNPSAEIKTGTWKSIDLMTKQLEKGKAISWLPRTAADYEELQRLARHVTDAKTMKDDATLEEGLRELLDESAQAILVDLDRTEWKDDAELTAANKLAAAGLMSPESGFFAYCKVVIPSASSQKLGDRPTVVFELIGTDTWVVLTVSENAEMLKKGTRWLILGIQDAETNIAIATNPDEPGKVVSLIHSKYIVGYPPGPADE